MGALKNLCIEVAEAGKCLVGAETLGYLDDLECQRGIDWIGYTEYDFTGHDGAAHTAECITIASARRLVAEGLANDEIADFCEDFGRLAPATPGIDQCSDCGIVMPAGRRANQHGERFCEECA